MKRLFTLMLIVFAAFMSQGEILYWQVTPSDLAGITDENTPYYASLYVTWIDNSGVEQFRSINSTYVSGYNPDTESIDFTTSDKVPVYDGLTYSADIGNTDDGEHGQYVGAGYSFFVEIANSNGKWLGYTDRKTYTQLADAGFMTGADLSNPEATVWHDTPDNVPEPTSGLLMLLGAACLGLRRKARSAA